MLDQKLHRPSGVYQFFKFLWTLERNTFLKYGLTVLCFVSLVLGVFYPALSAHNNVLIFVTNALWIWES
jgi:hypothetical protein